MAAEDLIEIQAGNRPDLDTQFIRPRAKDNLDKLPIPATTWLAIKRLAELWASEPTGEVLNYVYFHTEPMMDAQRGEPINFSRVAPRAEVPFYVRPKSVATATELHAARSRFRETSGSPANLFWGAKAPLTRDRLENQPQAFTPPRYDELFARAIETLDDESE
ncbi:MAG: hypothetical protein WBC04_14000 [Candidatus Acidiferrales bacterium]